MPQSGLCSEVCQLVEVSIPEYKKTIGQSSIINISINFDILNPNPFTVVISLLFSPRRYFTFSIRERILKQRNCCPLKSVFEVVQFCFVEHQGPGDRECWVVGALILFDFSTKVQGLVQKTNNVLSRNFFMIQYCTII